RRAPCRGMPADPTTASALDALLHHARAAGADAADASVSISESLSVDVRMGAFEGVERSESRSIGLRAFLGKRQAGATSSDLSPDGLKALAERVVAMARLAPEDPYCGLLDPAERATAFPDLDTHDDARPDADALEALAQEAEAAALAVPGVTNSSGAGASWSAGSVAMRTSDGFAGASRASSYGVGLSVIAERDGKMERDYEGRTTRFLAELPPARTLGQTAGERAVARLGARKLESRRAPVIFENRLASRIIGPLFGAISGAAVARGVSFMKDKLGQQVFAKGVSIEDDPFRKRGLASRPFDGEGAAGARRLIVDDGVLTTWLMNAAAARQLGLRSTGHATLGHGGPPGIASSNVTLLPGAHDLDALMAQAGSGVLVTEMFSPSLNANNGDWSVGFSGFWFENGVRAFPVSEITVAGNLVDIFARLVPGADLERRGAADAPSILVDDLAIAGV
ncbi:MAG: metallopeptidase TldD-related protein, partial [Hyphomonadaceae bacterium]|nr:metallopeptidase TldD-related protein [Hyphomonadaceae bacterium]